jgi:hypothetical protein
MTKYQAIRLVFASSAIFSATIANADQTIYMPDGGTCLVSKGGVVWGCNIPPPVVPHQVPQQAPDTRVYSAEERADMRQRQQERDQADNERAAQRAAEADDRAMRRRACTDAQQRNNAGEIARWCSQSTSGGSGPAFPR